MKITNVHGISVPLAVWLLHDEYDYIDEPNYISATSLLKPTKQIVLAKRVAAADKEMDISDFTASSFGTAIHDSMEKAWRLYGKQAMKRLGYPEKIWSNIVVNPTAEELAANPDAVPVWVEQRSFREITINGKVFKIGGKFDQVINGRLFDTKTTSVWSYIKGGKDKDYARQGGIYRWLNPHLIKDDHVFIQFVFTDWTRRDAKRLANYPPIKVREYPVKMLTLEETEAFIRAKIAELDRCWTLPEEKIPACTDEELWRGPTTYKYYSDPSKTDGRATKNFEDKAEAAQFQASKGGKGVIKAIPGEAKACEYCPAFPVCKQKDAYYES